MAGEVDAASEATTGSVDLEERDLETAIIDMSLLARARVGVALVLAFICGTLTLGGHLHGRDLAPQLAFGAFLLFFLFVSPRIKARRLLRAIAARGDRHASFRFDEDGVTFRTAGSTATTAYRTLVEYQEGPKAFLVYSSPGVAHIVPKRAFSPEGLARVGSLLAANVKKKRRRSANKLIVAWFAAILMMLVIWQFLSNQAR